MAAYRPAQARTDWDRVLYAWRDTGDRISAAASDPDAAPLDAAFWRKARVTVPTQIRKKHTGLRIDEDVLDWFRSLGRDYQTRMNAVLRAYVEAQKRGGQ